MSVFSGLPRNVYGNFLCLGGNKRSLEILWVGVNMDESGKKCLNIDHFVVVVVLSAQLID